MQNRWWTIFFAAVVGTMCGVFIVGARTAFMTLSHQQSQMLGMQETLERKVTDQQQAGAIFQMKILEKRVSDLEQKINILTALGGPQKPAKVDERQFPPQEDFSKVYDIPVGSSVVRGNKDAPITIVEFVDFQCPFCSRFHPALNDALGAYPDQVKYFLKNFPLSFHPQAKPAAKAAMAAGEQGKYWEMAELLLTNNSSLTEDQFKEFAKQINIDVDKFFKDYQDNDSKYEEIIKNDMDLGAGVNVQGTPTFFLNGRKTNARDLNTFKQEIDAILKAP